MPRTIVIGDIHGCFDELMELLQQLELKDEDFLLSLGDIVDRGNKSLEVYQFFKNRPNSKVLMGNHERKHLKGILNYAQEIVKVQFGSKYPSFLNWLQTLEYTHETPEAIIVHAAFEPNKSLSEQKEDVLSGSTSGERYLTQKLPAESFWQEHYQGEKPIIYGHHVVGDFPKIVNNTYGIDTGACHGGYLTALELPGFVIHQIKVETDHWTLEQNKWQLPVLQAKRWQEMDFGSIQKLLTKLEYLQNLEVKAFLQNVQKWLDLHEIMLEHLLDKLYVFSTVLTNTHQENFNEIASQYFFKTFLFKAKADKLTLEDLQKSLDTPAKCQQLAKAIDLEELEIAEIKIDASFNVLNLKEIIIGLIDASGFLFDIYKFNNAVKNIEFAINLSVKYDLLDMELQALSHMAYMQAKEIGNKDIMIKSLKRCIEIVETHFPTHKNDLAYYYYRLGQSYHHSAPEKLIHYHEKALSIQEFTAEDYISHSRIHRDLGNAFQQLEQFEKAEEHYLQAIHIPAQNNLHSAELGHSEHFDQIIRFYEKMNRPDLVLVFQKGRQIAKDDFYTLFPHLKQ